jgi:hypothetical protein
MQIIGRERRQPTCVVASRSRHGHWAVEHILESSRQPCISHVVAEGRAKTPHLTLTGFILNPKSQLTNHTAGRIMPRDHVS